MLHICICILIRPEFAYFLLDNKFGQSIVFELHIDECTNIILQVLVEMNN